MTTENLTAIYPASSDFTSESWQVLPSFACGSIQVVWSGIDSATGKIEIQLSNNNIDWNCYLGQTSIPVGSASQIYEFKEFTARFIRVRWLKYSVSAGTISIWTAGYTK